MNRLNHCLAAPLAALLVTLLPSVASATTAGVVPEPDSWALVALGVVAAAIVTIRNRRK